jgi:hypothetical protein
MNNTIVADIESRIDIVELVREYVPLKKIRGKLEMTLPFQARENSIICRLTCETNRLLFCNKSMRWATQDAHAPRKNRIPWSAPDPRKTCRRRTQNRYDSGRLADEKSTSSSSTPKYLSGTKKNSNNQTDSKREIISRSAESLLKLSNNGESGYSSDPREMFESMKKKWFSEKILMDSGIFVSQYKDRFFGRVIFPITNYRGEVIAFSGAHSKLEVMRRNM